MKYFVIFALMLTIMFKLMLVMNETKINVYPFEVEGDKEILSKLQVNLYLGFDDINDNFSQTLFLKGKRYKFDNSNFTNHVTFINYDNKLYAYESSDVDEFYKDDSDYGNHFCFYKAQNKIYMQREHDCNHLSRNKKLEIELVSMEKMLQTFKVSTKEDIERYRENFLRVNKKASKDM